MNNLLIIKTPEEIKILIRQHNIEDEKGFCRSSIYKKIRVNGLIVHEHRYIIEKVLGRKLTSEEFIHHKDGNKTNNSIENLEILSRKEHGLRHRN